jgi:hypothetical protein
MEASVTSSTIGWAMLLSVENNWPSLCLRDREEAFHVFHWRDRQEDADAAEQLSALQV